MNTFVVVSSQSVVVAVSTHDPSQRAPLASTGFSHSVGNACGQADQGRRERWSAAASKQSKFDSSAPRAKRDQSSALCTRATQRPSQGSVCATGERRTKRRQDAGRSLCWRQWQVRGRRDAQRIPSEQALNSDSFAPRANGEAFKCVRRRQLCAGGFGTASQDAEMRRATRIPNPSPPAVCGGRGERVPNLCAKPQRASVRFTGQNGKTDNYKSLIANSCGHKARNSRRANR